MNEGFRRVLKYVALIGAAVILSNCKAEPPPSWVAEYFPPGSSQQPPTGSTSTPPPGFVEPCHIMVLRTYYTSALAIVVVMKSWNGRQPPRNTKILVGENFSGRIELGPTTIHDDSTGYDLDIDATYISDSDDAAKERATTDCGTPGGMTPVR
jgi:hypothetical protein